MVHNLDIFQKFFVPVEDGRKTFEVREKRDRIFSVGDTIVLSEIEDVSKKPTGRYINKTITYVLEDENFCKKGYVILGIK